MKFLKVIAFSHKQFDLDSIGRLVIPDEDVPHKLDHIKKSFNIPELFYVATCNRVEFVFVLNQKPDQKFVNDLIHELKYADMCPYSRHALSSSCEVYEGIEALEHLIRTSCSLESLVIGEKEILAQIRDAYEKCKTENLTGDNLRLVIERVVKAAKEVYTDTDIAKNPISVVSLAYRKLARTKSCTNARILIIGAGETNKNFAQYLQKHKYSNFVVFNRTLEKAQKLAKTLGGEALPLSALADYNQGFDIIITCTGATEPIITPDIYKKLLNGDTKSTKTIVDMAIPPDTHPDIVSNFSIDYISVKDLTDEAENNKLKRLQEINKADEIIKRNITEFASVLKQRKIELAIKDVPQKIKEIRSTALDIVFANDYKEMSDKDKETLNKVLDYIEKKYISVPMLIAKDVLLEEAKR